MTNIGEKMEIWKDIVGYEGKYQVSNTGKIRSLKYNNSNIIKELKQKVNRFGFMEVKLSKNNIAKDYMVAWGLILAFLKILKENGINYQKRVRIVAQDLDFRSVYMTYIQLSLVGAKAKVVQGDTLADPNVKDNNYIFYTPMWKGVMWWISKWNILDG